MFNFDTGDIMISFTQSSVTSVVTKKKPPLNCFRAVVISSGRQDSNLRSPAPKAGALTGLGHAPIVKSGRKDT
jgi:hypothetical protein